MGRMDCGHWTHWSQVGRCGFCLWGFVQERTKDAHNARSADGRTKFETKLTAFDQLDESDEGPVCEKETKRKPDRDTLYRS